MELSICTGQDHRMPVSTGGFIESSNDCHVRGSDIANGHERKETTDG